MAAFLVYGCLKSAKAENLLNGGGHARLTGLLVGICVLFRVCDLHAPDILFSIDLETLGIETGLDRVLPCSERS